MRSMLMVPLLIAVMLSSACGGTAESAPTLVPVNIDATVETKVKEVPKTASTPVPTQSAPISRNTLTPSSTSVPTPVPTQSAPISHNTPTPSSTSVPTPVPTQSAPISRNTPTPSPPSASTPVPVPKDAKIITIQEGSVARYIVREQLVRWISEKNVSGETDLIDGEIIISSEGKLIPEGSRVVVNVKSLKSDERKRDNYIKDKALESNKFPEAIFEINSMEGLQGPFPTSGSINVNLTGIMTIHGVPKETTWNLSADVDENNVKGIAKTEIDFNLFNIRKPRLQFILSIEEIFRLELEFLAKVQSD